MGTTKNIEMREYNRSDYNLLLPKTNSYTKEETLTNYTKSLANLPDSATPDDVFLALIIGLGNKAYRIKVIYPNGLPAEGYTVTGLTALPNLNLITNSQGMVIGKSSSSSPTIRVSKKYDDVNVFNSSFNSVGTITDITITLSWNETAFTVSETKTITPLLSPFVTNLDFLLIGGGRSGGIVKKSTNPYFDYQDSTFGGRGGGGGRYYEQGSYPLKDIEQLIFAVGKGGIATPASGSYPATSADGEPSSISFLKNNVTTPIKTVNGGKKGGQGWENIHGDYPSDSDMYGGSGGLRGKNGRQGGNSSRQGYWHNEGSIGNPSYSSGGKGEKSQSISFHNLNLTISGGGDGADGAYMKDSQYYGGRRGNDNTAIGGGGGGEGVDTYNSQIPRNGKNGCIWYAFTH